MWISAKGCCFSFSVLIPPALSLSLSLDLSPKHPLSLSLSLLQCWPVVSHWRERGIPHKVTRQSSSCPAGCLERCNPKSKGMLGDWLLWGIISTISSSECRETVAALSCTVVSIVASRSVTDGTTSDPISRRTVNVLTAITSSLAATTLRPTFARSTLNSPSHFVSPEKKSISLTHSLFLHTLN